MDSSSFGRVSLVDNFSVVKIFLSALTSNRSVLQLIGSIVDAL